MLKLAALFATVTAALQCVLAERTLKIEQHVAEIQVISSDANARRLNLGFNKAVAIDLPTDLKEILVADPQTVNVVLRTVRRIDNIVGGAVGRTNVFFYDDYGQQIVALDVFVSDTAPLGPPELREICEQHLKATSIAGLFESTSLLDK